MDNCEGKNYGTRLSQRSSSQESIAISDNESSYPDFHSKEQKNKQFDKPDNCDENIENVYEEENLDMNPSRQIIIDVFTNLRYTF